MGVAAVSSDGTDTAAVLKRIVVICCYGEGIEIRGICTGAADEALEPGYALIEGGIGNDCLETPADETGYDGTDACFRCFDCGGSAEFSECRETGHCCSLMIKRKRTCQLDRLESSRLVFLEMVVTLSPGEHSKGRRPVDFMLERTFEEVLISALLSFQVMPASLNGVSEE